MDALWFVAGLALLVAEIASASFFAVFLAAGSFAAAIVAFFLPDSPIGIQALVALAVAVAGVVLVRPIAARRLHRRGATSGNPGVHGGFVGQRALALDEIGDELHPGHVRLAGETWLAVSDQPPVPAGQAVTVTAVRGTTLVVRLLAHGIRSES
jgi:inner membrane protein